MSTALRIVTVEGPAYERGRQLGTLLRDEIAEFGRRWAADVHARSGLDAGDFAHRFLTATDFLPAIRAHNPETLAEVEGMAAAAGVEAEIALVQQLVDEYWVQGRALAPEHCSALAAVPEAGPPLVAQNMDIETYRDGLQTVVHHVPDHGPQAFVLTNPGVIGFNGVNADGVAICCNTLADLTCSPRGLPVSFLVRGVLARRSLREAIDFVRGVPHASGQNYVLGGRDGVTDLECSAGGVVTHGDGHLVLHTNHPLSSNDVAQAALPDEERAWGHYANSTARLRSLRRHLIDRVVDLEAVRDALRARDDAEFPVCRRAEDGIAFTFASTIAELGDRVTFHVTPGPPLDHDSVALTFDR